jgi:hypothetical protein
MKLRLRDLLTAAWVISFGAAAHAATFDLVSYLGLNPGNWAVFQDRAGAISGYATTQTGTGEVTQTFYRLNGSTWVFDVAETFAVSNRRLSYIGSFDGAATLVFQPALNITRRQQVGDSTVYKGLLVNPSTGDTTSVTTAFSLSAEGIAVTVPAGTFTDCIKLRFYSQGGGSSRDSVSISCPNRNEAKTWYNKIKDTAVPTDEDQSQSNALVMIQAGDSNPPFPLAR